MLRATLVVLLLAPACALEPAAGLVIYRATPQTLPDGETRTRSLIVAGDLRVLAVDRGPEGVAVRTGTATGSDYAALRGALAAARHLAEDTAPREPGIATFEIHARFGASTIRLVRDPRRHVERDVARAVEALEAIHAGTGAAGDPVSAAVAFLDSPDPMVRGWATVALTKVYGAPATSAATRAAAEAALRAHLPAEDDPRIVTGIRDVIDQPAEK